VLGHKVEQQMKTKRFTKSLLKGQPFNKGNPSYPSKPKTPSTPFPQKSQAPQKPTPTK